VAPGPAVSRVAVLADDHVGMRPRFGVRVGERVVRGQPLFEDRKNPGVIYTAPGAGEVVGIHRGAQRALISVVIELGESERWGVPAEQSYPGYKGGTIAKYSATELRALLVRSGLWTALRSRPFSRTPGIVDPPPTALFVTAMDTQPGAPDLDTALAGRGEDLALGLQAMVKLAGDGVVYLCRNPLSGLDACGVAGVEVHEFAGPHPAGTVGLHIHTLAPVERDRVAWHVGVQDVVAIGRFLATERLDIGRVVALSGPSARDPRLIHARLGAAIDELAADEAAEGAPRVLSGSIWNGHIATGEERGYLGRFHQQITLLPEDDQRRFLGWLGPGTRKYSVHRLFLSWLTGRSGAEFSTSSHGSRRSMVPIGAYEKVFPFELMPTFLLRSMLAGDMERSQDLGVLELDEEDLALASFVCPSKIDFGPVLRDLLTRIEKEG
jgi:Na+-transporting NADH:ubiquinone oxidoreductase subunit A